MNNSKYYDASKLGYIKQELLEMNEDQFRNIQFIDNRDPLIMLIISIVGGTFGIDRMLLGQVGLGVLKLITGGGLGIWTLIDWFLIMNMTKQYNLEKLLSFTRYRNNSPAIQ